MNRPSSRLATQTAAVHRDALARTDVIGARVDEVIVRLWNRLMRLLVGEGRRREQGRQLGVSPDVLKAAAEIAHAMHYTAHATLADDFGRLAIAVRQRSADVLTQTVPLDGLRRAAHEQGLIAGPHVATLAPWLQPSPLREGKGDKPTLAVHVPGHGEVRFVADPVANPRSNVTILVDPAKLDADWSQDPTGG